MKPLQSLKTSSSEGSPKCRAGHDSGLETRWTVFGGAHWQLVLSLPPIPHPKSASDLDPSVVCVVCPCPMARLVFALTLAAATTSRTGGLVGAPTLAAAPTAMSERLVEAPILA